MYHFDSGKSIDWSNIHAALCQRSAYHADGPEGHEAVAAVGVAPGIPARILSLFQDEHLPTEVSLLKGNKAGEGGPPGTEGAQVGRGQERKIRGDTWMLRRVCPALVAQVKFVCPLTGRTPQWYYALYRCHGHTRSYTHSGPRSSCPGSSPGRTAWSAQRRCHKSHQKAAGISSLTSLLSWMLSYQRDPRVGPQNRKGKLVWPAKTAP